MMVQKSSAAGGFAAAGLLAPSAPNSWKLYTLMPWSSMACRISPLYESCPNRVIDGDNVFKKSLVCCEK